MLNYPQPPFIQETYLMKSSHLRLLGVIALAMAMLAAFFPTGSEASHAWGNYHWGRTSNPFTLKIGDNVTSAWDSYLNTTVSDWTQAQDINLTKVAGQSTKRCSATAGRVEVCNGTYGSNGWLGIAQIWLSGGHISQGTVKLNDTYFQMAQYNTPEERNHVMCQEVGHTLGLGHTSEDGTSQRTCMDYSQDPNSQHPNSHDYSMLSTIYSHLDSTSTIGNMPAAIAQGDFSDPSTWGRLMSTMHNGHESLYVQDFGNGNVLITHVSWATK